MTAQQAPGPMGTQSPERQRRIHRPLGPPADDPALERAFSVDLALLGLSEQSAGALLFDLGCGAGRHELAAVRLPVTTVACDLSRLGLRDGRFFVGEDAPVHEHRGSVEWLQADGGRLPFTDGTFDALLCSETLEHAWDDRALLRELRRVARPGARLAVSVPAYQPEWLLWWLSRAVTHTPGGHLRIYRPRDLHMKLAEAGWKPYASRRRHAFESVYWLLGALAGGGDPPPRIARAWRRLVNPEHSSRARLAARLERFFDPLLAKSIVLYARAV
jgi:SAM-dependent methyltransferase